MRGQLAHWRWRGKLLTGIFQTWQAHYDEVSAAKQGMHLVLIRFQRLTWTQWEYTVAMSRHMQRLLNRAVKVCLRRTVRHYRLVWRVWRQGAELCRAREDDLDF